MTTQPSIKKKKKHKSKSKSKSKKEKRNCAINKRVDEKIIELFGRDYFNIDKKLMKQSINILNNTKLCSDYHSNDTEISDDSSSECLNRKVYSIHPSNDIMKIRLNSQSKSSTENNSHISHTKNSSELHNNLNIKVSIDNEKYVPIKIDNNGIKHKKLSSECFNIESAKKNIQDAETNINNDKAVIIKTESSEIVYSNIQGTSSKIDTNCGVEEKIELPIVINKSSDTQNKIKGEKMISYLKNMIGSIIDIDDQIYKNAIIEDLAVTICNSSCLSKYIWMSLEYKLIEELILRLIENFNDDKFNMAKLSYCFICVFLKIANKSSILPDKMKLKFIKFIHIIQKIILYYDKEMWRKWFSPSIFLDWCFVLAAIFIPLENDIHILVFDDMLLVNNAMIYFHMVKDSKYVFINKKNTTLKTAKRGIFEFTRSDDIIDIDNMSNARVISKNDNNELNSKKLKLGSQSKSNEIKHTNVDEEMSHSQLKPQISVCAEFNLSNSFKKKISIYKKVGDKSLKLIESNSGTNEVQKNLNSKHLKNMVNNISNVDTRSVNVNKRNIHINEANINEQVTSLPQEISTNENNRSEIITTNRNLSKYYNNIFANPSTQPPSYLQTLASMPMNIQPNQNSLITSNNSTQINFFNTIYHSNDYNNVMNTTYYTNNNNSPDLPNTIFGHPETTNLSSQHPSSLSISSRCLNQLTYSENFNNTQLPSINTISTNVPSRLNSMNTALPGINNCHNLSCNLCNNMSVLDSSSIITTPAVNFQPTAYNSQVIISIK